MKIFCVIIDSLVVIFDFLLYMYMAELKEGSRIIKSVTYGGCALIFAFYMFTTYVFGIPSAMASYICVSIPSFFLFFSVSKYRDARFIVTLCFIDTISLIISFLFRSVGMLFGDIAGYISSALLIVFLIMAFIFLRPYFTKYRELLESVNHGWVMIMISMLVVYAGLIFITQYPVPLMDRIEDFPMFLAVSIMVVSFETVFLYILTHKKHLRMMNDQLLEQQKWHNMAYIDALTDLDNRASYIKHINDFESTLDVDTEVCAMVFDLNEFKSINDTFGHNTGDATLKAFADALRSIFPHNDYHVFRVGGDEFAVISINVPEEEVLQKLAILRDEDFTKNKIGCTVAIGYWKVDLSEHNAIDNAFIKADEEMYKNKKDSRKK